MERGRGTAREPLLERVRKSAGRARELIAKLLRSRRHAASSGGLESLQQSLESLEARIETYDLPVDTSRLRTRLEALLSILLEIKDDRIAGEAAGPLEATLIAELPRLESVFVRPGEFFALLDSSAADLAQVRASADAGDYGNARAALAATLKRKAVTEDVAIWLSRTAMHSRDDALLAARGFVHDRDGSLVFSDWPVRWELVPDVAHRHDEFATLAREYAASTSESLATLAAEHVLEWAVSVPPPGARHSAGAWSPVSAAYRLMNWSVGFVALRKSKAFTPEFARVFMSLVYESASFVAQSISGLRHDPARAAAAAALAVSGTVFDHFASAQSWTKAAAQTFDTCSRSAVLPDGGHVSGSMEIHERVFEAFTAGVASGAGSDDMRGVADAARKMLRFHRSIMLPDGTLPYGKPQLISRPGERASRLSFASSLLGVTEEKRAAEFHSFPDSGAYVMRAGSDSSAEYFLVRSGGSRELVVASAAGQVMRVGGSPSQSETGVVPQPAADGPRDVVVRPGPPTDYVRTVTGLARGAYVHRREVLFVDRRYFVLCDRVQSDEAVGWSLELEFPSEVSCSADGRRLQSSGYLVVLAAPTDCGWSQVDAAEGQTSTVRGMQARTHGRDVSFIVLVYPLREDMPEQITVEPVVSLDRGVGLILKRPSSEDLVCFPHGEDLNREAVPPGSQAVVLSRPAGSRDAPWRKSFEIRDDG